MLGKLCGFTHYPLRARPESEIDSSRGAEEIRDERKCGAFYVSEEKGGAPFGYYTPVDLRRFEHRIDGRLDLDYVPLFSENVEKAS